MTNQSYIGIDPGCGGGIAILADGKEPWSTKMPETVRDVWDTINALRAWSDRAAIARIEFVSSSSQMGVKSAFTFGNGYGRLEMALTATGIPWDYVRPQVWQKALGCLTKGDKNVSKAKAQQLFPGMKVTHANADALLIAEYCRRSSV